MSEMLEWIHDDITWCVHGECIAEDCFRHPKYMHDHHAGLHCFADFSECDECPLYRMEKMTEEERGDGS